MINFTALNSIKTAKSITNTQSNGFRYSAYIQKPDTFERTCPVNFTGSSNRTKQYNKTADALKTIGQNAQLSLDGQLAQEGWAGKVADAVSVLWNSKNRAVLVQKDIDKYNQQIDELKASIKEKKFPEKFQEIFGVEYHNANIVKYNKKVKQFKLAVTTKAMSDIISEKLSGDLKQFKENGGKLQDKVEKKVNPYAMTGSVPFLYHTTSKEQIFESMENSLVAIVGSKESLTNTLKSSGMDTEKMSMEEKYHAYGIMAEFLDQTMKDTAKNVCKGKTIAELQKEYDESYEKAYGHTNDIQERVDKYNRSQEIGAAAVRGATRSALSALVLLAAPQAGFAKIVAQSATTLGIKVLVDGSDKLSSDVEGALDSKNFKKLVHSASISGAEKLASGVLGSVIPGFDTGYEFLDEVLDQTKAVASDTVLGLASEKLKKGKWATNQIVPRMLISFVFRNISPNDDVIKELLSVTKGSVNQAMKYSTRDRDVVKAFMEGTKQALSKIDVKDKKSLEEMKKLSQENPEQFLTIMMSTLEQMIDENSKENND